MSGQYGQGRSEPVIRTCRMERPQSINRGGCPANATAPYFAWGRILPPFPPEAAQQAAEKMVASLSDAKVLYENKMTFGATTIAGKSAWKSEPEGYIIAVNGNYVVMETFSEPRGAGVLEKVLQAQK